ncbi:hypothetical protein P4562_06765 [Lysinibacillus xylanilyticus]|uniref:hypothetical protein n=1 Tax=Lysinibacillus xylanilyticus TaxID=582475 RepID=UPI002E1D97DA|nr:hypothetical protein [Lysinibacillus xylanilyticus]
MNIGWDFPSNNNGRIDGLNDSGIHHFTEAPIVSMTREVLQDSLDAAASNKPVIVKFELHQLALQALPEVGELKQIFQRGQDTWTSHKDASKFFEEGLLVLQQQTIPVLAIRDFNTTGLENVDQKINGSFASLVKSVGVTFKDASASGSFGIGKHAPFAASSIRTMFYVTYNRQGVYALQGVSKLASYDMGNGNYSQGTGYYGVKGVLEPVKDLTSYDPMFLRSGYGTDKFIIGFNAKGEWADEVIETIILSYLVAVMEEKLEVHIAGLKINKQMMPSIVKYIMGKYKSSKASQYYDAYTSPDSVKVTKYFKTYDGEFEPINVSLLVKEGFNRRVSMYRGTGMKIFDKDRFRAPIDFAGVMVVEGAKLNAALRKMEPPTHDRWAAGLYKDDQQYALQLLKQIYDWLNGQARELAKSQATEKIELRGLEGILPDVTKEEAPLKEVNEQALSEKIISFAMKQTVSKPKKIKIQKKKKKNTFLEDEKSEREKTKKPVNPNSEKTEKLKKATFSNARSFCVNEDQGLYRFIITSKGKGELSFNIHISGEDGSKTPIAIKAVKNITRNEAVPYSDNIIGPVIVEDKERIVYEVSFVENERYSLEVSI